MVTVVSSRFVEISLLFALSNMIVSWSKFSLKSFSKNGMALRNPKKKSEKRELTKNKWYNRIAQVGTNWSTWNKWYKEKRVFRSTWNKWNRETGVFRSSWNPDKGSVLLNLSTCSKVGVQGRGLFLVFHRETKGMEGGVSSLGDEGRKYGRGCEI